MISPAATLFRLRRFLLVLSILLFGGTVVELSLVKHWGDVVQLIPFVLCVLGSIAALLALLRPRRATLLGLRVCMGVIMCGSLFGIYEHFSNNIAFQREIKPSASMREVFVSASIGIALSSSVANGPEAVLRNADLALYRAKAEGPNRVAVADTSEARQIEGTGA